MIIQIFVDGKRLDKVPIKSDTLVDCSGSGETPTGMAWGEDPAGTSDEEAEAMPVESEPAVAEIRFLQDSTNSKR